MKESLSLSVYSVWIHVYLDLGPWWNAELVWQRELDEVVAVNVACQSPASEILRLQPSQCLTSPNTSLTKPTVSEPKGKR